MKSAEQPGNGQKYKAAVFRRRFACCCRASETCLPILGKLCGRDASRLDVSVLLGGSSCNWALPVEGTVTLQPQSESCTGGSQKKLISIAEFYKTDQHHSRIGHDMRQKKAYAVTVAGAWQNLIEISRKCINHRMETLNRRWGLVNITYIRFEHDVCWTDGRLRSIHWGFKYFWKHGHEGSKRRRGMGSNADYSGAGSLYFIGFQLTCPSGPCCVCPGFKLFETKVPSWIEKAEPQNVEVERSSLEGGAVVVRLSKLMHVDVEFTECYHRLSW